MRERAATSPQVDMWAVGPIPSSRAIHAVAPLLRALAVKRGAYGVDADDTRRLALHAGLITGSEGKGLSWFAAVPKAAGLIFGGYRRTLNQSRNRHAYYVLP